MTQETNDVVTQELIERLRRSHGAGDLQLEAADALQSQSARIAELEGALDDAAAELEDNAEAFGAVKMATWQVTSAQAAAEARAISLTKDSTSG